MARFERYQQKMAHTYTGSGGASQTPLTPPDVLQQLAAQCGVQFNGDAPWDIRVHNEAVYNRILSQGSLGFGESYMDGLWDCPRLDQLFYRLLKFNIELVAGSKRSMSYVSRTPTNSILNLLEERKGSVSQG